MLGARTLTRHWMTHTLPSLLFPISFEKGRGCPSEDKLGEGVESGKRGRREAMKMTFCDFV